MKTETTHVNDAVDDQLERDINITEASEFKNRKIFGRLHPQQLKRSRPRLQSLLLKDDSLYRLPRKLQKLSSESE